MRILPQEEQAHCKEEQVCGHPPPGDQPQNCPEERRAPTRELDRPPLFFDSVGTHEFILDIGGYMSEVAHGSGTMVQCLEIMFLSFSSAPLLCPRPLSHLARGVSDGGPFATSLCSLTQAREMLM